MLQQLLFFGALTGLVACNTGSASGQSVPPTQTTSKKAPLKTTSGPVLVELFTSQGCSSCPPADELLSMIGQGKMGDDVIPLAYHVDYWDYIGWKDPFSKKEWSTLQRQYAKNLDNGRVYTPMLVSSGRSHVVGSRRSAVESSIESARKHGLELQLDLKNIKVNSQEISATIEWSTPTDALLFIALSHSGLRTKVKSGENHGRDLLNNHIVKELVQVPVKRGMTSSTVALPYSDAPKSKLVAFARDKETMQILGATSLAIPRTPKSGWH